MTEPTRGFVQRTLLGWISEFVNRPLPGAWPQIPLDDVTLADFDAYFDLCRECGYTDVALWGLFVDHRWPVDIASCVDADRRQRIGALLQAAHARGLRVFSGLGIYSWGFDAIIEAHPELSRDNPRVMCASVPEAWDWMARVLDFVMGEFDLDGLDMQSADNGRCTCPDCRGLTTVAYHAALNRRVAETINHRWPGKCLVVNNWGCPFSDPADFPALVELSRHVSLIIDQNNSAMQPGRDYRRALIDDLACPYGTLAGRSVWPPQRWPRDKWFLPTTLSNVAYLRDLHADGGRAIDQFVTTLANPSGEITLRFMGKFLADVEQDTEQLLREVVEQVYAPRDAATLDGLVEIVAGAETAYFAHAGRDLEKKIDLMYIDGGLQHSAEPNPATYLRAMTADGRRAYTAAMQTLADDFARLAPGVGEHAKAELTARCFQTVLADCRSEPVAPA